MSKYDELIFEIVCIGIHNRKGDMPEWFREALKDNCSWQDTYILLNAILFRLNTNSFSNTITLLQSVSPLGEEEIIALQENKKNVEPQSCFMFLVFANEAFGYTHDQTLDSSFTLILSLLREHGYIINERNRYMSPDKDEELKEGEEWVTVVDFDTGKPKRLKKVNMV